MTATQVPDTGKRRGPTTTEEGADQQPVTPATKPRRRPMVYAVAVALIALGGLLSAYVVTAVSDATPVIALRADVDRGEVIEADDLVVAQISGDPVLTPIPSSDRDGVIGQRAARDLTAGTLLTSSAVTSETLPTEGQSLVGVALTPAQLPSSPLQPGDAVRIVSTPRPQDDPAREEPTAVDATVVSSRQLPDGTQVIVDVSLPDTEASGLASLVATGRVAIVLDGVS